MPVQTMGNTLSLENLPTIEQFWAAFQESRKEFDRRSQEADRRMQEADRQMQELREQSRETDRIVKETAIAMKETDERLKETERIVKENGKQIGGLHNSFGELAEHLVAPGVARLFNERGHHFNTQIVKGLELREGGKIKAEIDILLENGDSIVAVEVKSKVQVKYGKNKEHDDVLHHIQLLDILRKHRQGDPRKIYGAIAGAIFGSEAKEAAIQAGFYVLEQSGDTMKMDVPDGFKPREW